MSTSQHIDYNIVDSILDTVADNDHVTCTKYVFFNKNLLA